MVTRPSAVVCMSSRAAVRKAQSGAGCAKAPMAGSSAAPIASNRYKFA